MKGKTPHRLGEVPTAPPSCVLADQSTDGSLSGSFVT
jgi:hypothetical protein